MVLTQLNNLHEVKGIPIGPHHRNPAEQPAQDQKPIHRPSDSQINCLILDPPRKVHIGRKRRGNPFDPSSMRLQIKGWGPRPRRRSSGAIFIALGELSSKGYKNELQPLTSNRRIDIEPRRKTLMAHHKL